MILSATIDHNQQLETLTYIDYVRMSISPSSPCVWLPVIYTYVTGFGETDHNAIIDTSRNTDLKYWSCHGSLVLDCSHAGFAV